MNPILADAPGAGAYRLMYPSEVYREVL
jgi:hypothetical protein